MVIRPLFIVIVAGLGIAFGALAPEVMRTTLLDCRCRRKNQTVQKRGPRNMVIAATRTDPASGTKKARKGSSR